MPYVFTEQGVAMLSSLLNSEPAIQVNIAIMRVFVRLREMMATHKELALKLRELESRIQDHDEQIVAIFEAIRQLMAAPEPPRKKIGFEVKESAASYGKKVVKKGYLAEGTMTILVPSFVFLKFCDFVIATLGPLGIESDRL